MGAEDSERLLRLESEVARLRLEVTRLREQVGLHPSAAAPPASAAAANRSLPVATTKAADPAALEPPPAPPAAHVRVPARHVPVGGTARASPAVESRAGRSVEELVGRYGTIVVATITLMVGVGVFLNWAIQHGLLAPTTRIALGYLVAAAVAGVGVRLRLRGTHQFGNVLLAMALCVAHLVCWSAGPLLHVMPSLAALAIGFVSSAVLSEFALRHDEQSLCALGFGGAAIAPFITSDSSGNVIALAVYGAVVIALSAAALGDRPWRTARGVTMGSVLVYVLAVAEIRPVSSAWPWIIERILVLFPIGLLAAIILLARGRHRRPLVRVAALALIFGAMMRPWTSTDPWALGLTLAGGLLAIGTLDRPGLRARDRETLEVGDGWYRPLLDALALPIGLFVAALMAVQPLLSVTTALVSMGWALLAGHMTYRRRGAPEAEFFAATATLTALFIAPAALSGHERSAVVGLAAVGVGLGFAAVRLPRLAFGLGALSAVGVASAWSVILLSRRRDFSYLPFLTPESTLALATAVAWLVLRRFGWEPRPSAFVDETVRSVLKRVPMLGASLTAFLWARAELASAWSVTASTALLIVYYAATGTYTIWLGRRRGPKGLRVAGLVLTLWAAGKALVEATDVPGVPLRVGLYFAVSAFLIAVAYWYRTVAGKAPPPAETESPA